jgi:RNA polymerase sigma-32 factor
MKAVRRFDPNRGVRLVSFALHWIKAEIHEYILRNWRMVKVATTKAQRKLFFNLRGMKKSHVGLTREQAQEIATALKVKPEEVFEMEMRLSSQDVALDPQPNDEGESVSPLAYLTDSEDEPSRILEHEETERNKSAGLARALATLDPRSRKIIEARWLNEGNESTLQTLADEYGVSAERIRQIEVKAMKTMRRRSARSKAAAP